MTVKGILGFRGEKTAGNPLTHPPGTLAATLNLVIPEKDVLMTRRGQKLTTYIDNDATNANANIAKQVYQWGVNLFVHYTGNAGAKLALWKNWATSPVYSNVGSFTEPASTVLRMKFAELARSVFFTTNAGLYTMAASTDTARKAGLRVPIILMLDPDAGIGTRLFGNPNATGSWYAKNQSVGYRAVCGRVDSNGRVILSGPSGRIVVRNPTDQVVPIDNMARAGTTVTAFVTANHRFRVGDVFDLSPGEANFPAGNKTITGVVGSPGTITYTEAGAAVANGVQQTISSGTKSVQLYIELPGAAGTTEVAAGDFIRVYRTDESAGESSDPGDEQFLAYERTLTAADITAGATTIIDTTPSAFLSEPLDTNAGTGDGPELGFNERPPLMRDVCRWDGRLWGLETTDRHRLRLRLLGTGAPNGLQTNDVLAVNTRVFDVGSTFVAYTDFLPTENVDRTTYFIALTLFGSDTLGLTASQEHDGDTGLGEVLLEEIIPGSTMADGSSGAINAIYAATSRPSAWGDRLATTKAVTSASTARTLTTTVTVRCAGHGFVAGQVIMLAKWNGDATDANFPLGLKTVATVVDANNFTYTESGANATLAGGSRYYAYATTYKSDNNRQLVRFSKQKEPDAWPVPNSPDGFPDGAEGLRVAMLASGDGLLVALKDGGFFTVTGTYPYVVRPLDDTASLVAADSLVKHAGQLTGLTTQGLATISEAGVGIVGGDIENKMRTLITKMTAAQVATVFAVSYESERQYILFAPSVAEDGTIGSFSYPDRAYVFHSFFGQFTEWGSAAGTMVRSCGLVWSSGDYLVLGEGYFNNQLRLERKTLGVGDFVDTEYAGTANGSQTDVNSVTLTGFPSTTYANPGDVALIGGTYYRIASSSLSLGAGFIGLESGVTVTVTNGQAITIYNYIQQSLTWAVDTRGMPGVEERWRQLQLHFSEHVFKAFVVTYKGEKSATTGDVYGQDTAFVINTPVRRLTTSRAKVHDNFERVAQQQISFRLGDATYQGEPFSYFKLLGYSGSSQPITEKTGQ